MHTKVNDKMEINQNSTTIYANSVQIEYFFYLLVIKLFEHIPIGQEQSRGLRESVSS